MNRFYFGKKISTNTVATAEPIADASAIMIKSLSSVKGDLMCLERMNSLGTQIEEK